RYNKNSLKSGYSREVLQIAFEWDDDREIIRYRDNPVNLPTKAHRPLQPAYADWSGYVFDIGACLFVGRVVLPPIYQGKYQELQEPFVKAPGCVFLSYVVVFQRVLCTPAKPHGRCKYQ